MLNGILGNWRTTLLGIISGAATYLLVSGPKFPTTKAEWGAFLAGLAQAAWGAAMKDSAVGVQASGAPQAK